MSGVHIPITTIPAADDPVLGEVVRRLVHVYRPERIYLFGSTARGDAGPDSDYDLMIILPDEAPRELQRARPALPGATGNWRRRGCAGVDPERL